MRRNFFKTMAVVLGLCLIEGSALAQGFVIHMKDGSRFLYKGEDVEYVGIYTEEPSPVYTQTFSVNGVQFTMVDVEGGTFMMGATEEQGDQAFNSEKPAHEVTLSSFSIGETEVTQGLWSAVMGDIPQQQLSGSEYPVMNISWYDCQTFVSKLSQLTGRTFRLPTEAEWEYAARGGNHSNGFMYAGSNDIDEIAWIDDNCGNQYHEVAMKKANELGLYDMSGNMWEWCQDWYGTYPSEAVVDPTGPETGSYRIFRGGGWLDEARDCRVSRRYNFTPSSTDYSLGLRVVLELQ